ncbi:MAG: type III-B CRISPR module RAMP protein Cmr1 [Dehalococcoidia bacterium]
MRVSFNAELITPLLAAGADSKNRDPQNEGLRPASIRGDLRYWFRAMMGPYCDLAQLKTLESRVFGSTDGKSPILIRSRFPSTPKTGKYPVRMNDPNPPPGKNFNPQWPAIDSGQSCSVSFSFPDSAIKEGSVCLNSLLLISMLSGIGGRTRRGFGSVQFNQKATDEGKVIENLPVFNIPTAKDLDDIKPCYEDGIKKVKSNFYAFSSSTAVKGTDKFATLENGKVRIWLVKPLRGFWTKWDDAMNGLRTSIYKPYKGNRSLQAFGSAKPRLTSPLSFQIKRAGKDQYFGVILAFLYDYYPNEIASVTNYFGTNGNTLASFISDSSLNSREVIIP